MKQVRSLVLSPDSVDITYMEDSTDVRADGQHYQTHTISLGREDGELVGEFDALETAVLDLLTAGLARWSRTLPVSPADMVNHMERLAEALNNDDEDDEVER